MTKKDKLNNYANKELKNIIKATIHIKKVKHKTIKLWVINRNKKQTTITAFEIKSYYNKYYKKLIEKFIFKNDLDKCYTRKFIDNYDILLKNKLDYIFRNILDYVNYEL